VQPPGEDEWEALPHLDSTMLSRGGSLPVVLPRSALPERPSPRSETPASGQKFDPLEHTMQTEERDPPTGSAELDDDLPTPVRGTSLADMGLDSDSEFAEDTDKGDGPKGFGKHVDPSLTFDADDIETLD
jgi:hypothetical protein